jgi:CheY-like chemotaxis protein
VALDRYILVVEDDDRVRDALRALLMAAGYCVACAGNGREALDRLTQQERPFVILLDLGMPVMDGWHFRKELQRSPPLARIPVLLLSAEANLACEAASLGAAAWFPKPVELERLLETVRVLAEAPLPD